MRALLLLAVLASGCTTAYYPSGKKALVIGSNVRGLHFKSGGLEISGDFDNAIIIQKSGAAVSQGIMSAMVPAATGGVIK